MKLLNAIYTILSSSSDVTDLLGGAASLQPIRAKKPANYPVLVYRITNTLPYDTKSGPSTVDRVEVKFIIAAKDTTSYAAIDRCVDIEEQLRLLIDRCQYGTYAGVQLGGVRFMDAYFGEWNPDQDVSELHCDYHFRVKRDPDYNGPLNVVPEELIVERLVIEDFEPTSGNTIELSNFPAEILNVVRNESPVIDWTRDDKVITFNSDGDFGVYGAEKVRIVYIKNYS